MDPRLIPWRERVQLAAAGMDWGQVVAHGGPPCFHLEERGVFCGRAKFWAGHETKGFHEFVPFAELVRLALEGGPTR